MTAFSTSCKRSLGRWVSRSLTQHAATRPLDAVVRLLALMKCTLLAYRVIPATAGHAAAAAAAAAAAVDGVTLQSQQQNPAAFRRRDATPSS